MTKENFIKRFDQNKDVTLSPEEIKETAEMMELELREEKAESQKKMAWVALWSIILFTLGLFSPFLENARVTALSNVIEMFYITQSSVIAVYFGTQAWLSRKL